MRSAVVWPERFTGTQKARARALVRPQPPPVPNGAAAWPAVVAYTRQSGIDAGERLDMLLADMIARDESGRQKYGVPLTANNGRDALVDAYQEALDMVVYLFSDSEDSSLSEDERWHSAHLFRQAIDMAHHLRMRILFRSGK